MSEPFKPNPHVAKLAEDAARTAAGFSDLLNLLSEREATTGHLSPEAQIAQMRKEASTEGPKVKTWISDLIKDAYDRAKK